MGKKILFLLVCALMSVNMVFAQTSQVTGTVIDSETGEPLIGAQVKVEGTNIGALTDLDGKFTLKNLPRSAKQVVVSYMGMNTVTAYIKPHMAITLTADAQDMNEVMVVAYGTQKKGTFTGSAAIVGAEDIEKVQVTNAVDALRGKAAGVQINTSTGQPGSTPSVRIRGINSINAGNDPLIVVDGSPYDGSLNDINPTDVESMTVLKDASSTALYGARGGNGVILITTKTAKKNQKATLNLDAKWGSNMRAVPNYEMITNPAQYYEMWYNGLNNYAQSNLNMDANKAWQWANQNLTSSNEYGLGYNAYSVPEGQYMIGLNGKLNPNATLGNIVSKNGQEYMIVPDDWTDATYGNGLRQEYTLSANGGSEKGSFYASANYLSNEGITVASDYQRFTGRLKADYMVKDWLRVGANMNYGRFNRNYLGNDGASGSSGNVFALTNIAPIYPIYIRDGKGNIIFDETSGHNLYDYGDRSYHGLYRPYLSQANPLNSNLLDTNNTEGNTFNGTGTFDIYLPYGFTFTSINNAYLRESRYTNTTNRYFGQYASSNGQVVKEHDRTFSYNYQQRLNWIHQYGKNNVEVMLGHEYYRLHDYNVWGSKSNQAVDSNKELDGAVVLIGAGSSASDYNTESWLARAMYNYDEKYFVNVSGMRQASSNFHKDNRWGTFWSAGAGWMMTKEKWFEDVNWLNELKLKASYGENGNDAIGSFRYINYYNIVNSDNQVSFTPAAYGNPEIKWEKNAKFNVGADFSMFDNRFYGSVEYYSNRTTDMLSWFPMAPSFGYTGYYANVGNVRNNGVEIDLHGEIIRNKDLKWDIYANLTSNHNEITSLPKERRTQEKDGRTGYSSGSYFYTEGMSVYTMFDKKFAGLDPETGESMWYKNVYKKDANGDYLKNAEGAKIVEEVTTTKTYSEADDYLLGDVLPDVYGGFGTGLDYKGFDVSVDFQYQLGGKVYDSSYASLMGMDNGYGMHKDLLNAWSPSNTGSSIPRYNYADTRMNASSDRFLEKASYLSLQNITLGYTLPAGLLRKLDISKIRVYAVADNIWVWSARRGLDPRQSITGGASQAYYSSIRSISAGVNVTF